MTIILPQNHVLEYISVHLQGTTRHFLQQQTKRANPLKIFPLISLPLLPYQNIDHTLLRTGNQLFDICSVDKVQLLPLLEEGRVLPTPGIGNKERNTYLLHLATSL